MPEINQTLAQVLRIPVEQISDNLKMSEVDTWDSLSHMELISTLEKQYQVQLTFDEIVSMKDVQTIRNIITSKTK